LHIFSFALHQKRIVRGARRRDDSAAIALSLSLSFANHTFSKSQLLRRSSGVIPKRERDDYGCCGEAAQNGNNDIVAASFQRYIAPLSSATDPRKLAGLAVIAETFCTINFPRRSQERCSDLIINALKLKTREKRERKDFTFVSLAAVRGSRAEQMALMPDI